MTSFPFRLSQILHNLLPKGILMPLDPITAGLNALASFNQYLCTPAGQKFADNFNDLVGRIFTRLEAHLGANAPK